MPKKISKLQFVKDWLLAHKSITARQCSKMFGYDRLSDGIMKLRRRGMRIHMERTPGDDRFLNKVKYGVYTWLGERPKIRKASDKNSVLIISEQQPDEFFDFIHNYPMSDVEKTVHIKNFLSKRKIKAKASHFSKDGLHILIDTYSNQKYFFIKYIPK